MSRTLGEPPPDAHELRGLPPGSPFKEIFCGLTARLRCLASGANLAPRFSPRPAAGGGLRRTPVTDQELLGFISGSIRSVWGLELLLLLKRQPERAWASEELVRELRASTMVVDESLEVFRAAGLVMCEDDGRCTYAPASPVLAQLCDDLEKAYRERPVAIVNAIASRRDKIQSFADAFRLKDQPK